MQDVETKDSPRIKPTVARVKWLEENPIDFKERLKSHGFGNDIKHLSLFDRLKRMLSWK